MSIFIVDIEADGPVPGLYSMISFAAIRVQPDLKTAPTFKAETAPISEKWIQAALEISCPSREVHKTYPDQAKAMRDFAEFIKLNSIGNPVFLSDNPAFDWQFINYYFALNDIKNPFGFSARRIGDFYAGLKHNWFSANKWKSLKITKHTHDPLDDVRGNAEAFIEICRQHSIRY